MKRALAMAVAAMAAVVAQAADVTFRLQITIPDAQVAEWRKMLDSDTSTFPILYSNQVTVVNGVTNTAQVVVVETDRQKASRISAYEMARWWRRQLQAYRNRTVPSVATDPVSVVVQ
jgi:opacity protein-like surface antigen